MKCSHPRAAVIEFGSSSTTHMRDRHGEWIHHSDFGDYNGIIEVSCPDCGIQRTYQHKRPKWVQALLDEANSEENQMG